MKKLAPDIKKMLGIEISADQEEAFQIYASELLKWNQSHSLTAIRDVEGVRIRHFLDSLSCLLAMDSSPHMKVIDVGSGAGLPGLALKIVQDSMQLTLLESVGKKVHFIDHMVQVLRLKDVNVEKARAEDYAHEEDQRESYDWAIARALAPLNVLAEYLLPFVCLGGFMLAQKGAAAEEESANAQSTIDLLGGGKVKIQSVDIPGLDEKRNLVIIEKISMTGKKYPRSAGVPKKRPL